MSLNLRDLAFLKAASGAGASPLLTGLISYWSMDEASGTRNDSRGTNHATVVGTPTSQTGRVAGAVGTTAGNYVEAASNASLQTGNIDFTLAVWVWFDLTTASYVVAKWQGGQLEHTILLNGVFQFLVSTTGLDFPGVSASTFGSPVISTWYFVVAWHDSVANTINIQVNDGAVDSAGHTGGVFASTAQLQFGASAFGPLAGRVDEVGFWKRTLTAPERSALYAAGSGLTYPFQ